MPSQDPFLLPPLDLPAADVAYARYHGTGFADHLSRFDAQEALMAAGLTAREAAAALSSTVMPSHSPALAGAR